MYDGERTTWPRRSLLKSWKKGAEKRKRRQNQQEEQQSQQVGQQGKQQGHFAKDREKASENGRKAGQRELREAEFSSHLGDRFGTLVLALPSSHRERATRLARTTVPIKKNGKLPSESAQRRKSSLGQALVKPSRN